MTYDAQVFGKRVTALQRLSPDAAKAFNGLHATAFADGALDRATKELTALAISVVKGCEDCCGYHLDRARRAGATVGQVADILAVAMAMGGGPALTYAAKVAELVTAWDS